MHASSMRPRRAFVAGLALTAALLLWAGFQTARPVDTVYESEEHAFRIDTVATGFGVPWGFAFLPDGRMLVTEKEGNLRLVSPDGLAAVVVEGLPPIRNKGQGGLLDVALHPNYAENGWLYMTFSDPHPDKDAGFTALLRGRLDGQRLVDQEVLFRAPLDHYSDRGVHFGSRIVFDREGYLYFSIGDRGQQDDAQRIDRPNGKVHRLHDDGRIPADNPFVDQADAVRSVWSYGHRNPQGLTLEPATGALWGAEHGPKGGDELNHIRRARNYGWPVITYGINYNDTPITDLTEKEGMEQPATHWVPSIAVSAIDFYDGNAFPEWRGDLFVGSLKNMELRRIELDGTRVTHQEIVLNIGTRIRDLETGPDGYLYLALENPGRIVRLVPAAL